MGDRLAYDQVLIQAYEMLEIEHDLRGETAGMERDIERIRVEAELEVPTSCYPNGIKARRAWARSGCRHPAACWLLSRR